MHPNNGGGNAMRTILVLNSKGGCGKSTIATNLAAYYASHGHAVALADFDPQASSLEWLAPKSTESPDSGTRCVLRATPNF